MLADDEFANGSPQFRSNMMGMQRCNMRKSNTREQARAIVEHYLSVANLAKHTYQTIKFADSSANDINPAEVHKLWAYIENQVECIKMKHAMDFGIELAWPYAELREPTKNE